MRKYFTIIIITGLASTLPVLSQTVPSSCNAPDSIKRMYQDDADRMALRYIMDKGTTWKDSATIEPARSQQYMDALMAVYNATALPARDTVVEMGKVHTQVTEFALNEMNVHADSNLTWMKAFRDHKLITGDSTVDFFLKDFTLDSSWAYFGISSINGIASLDFRQSHNLFALGNTLETLPGVDAASPQIYISSDDGGDIRDSIYPEFIELTYRYGWIDCIIDCWYERFWVFRVHPDCSVEYVRSYGDKMPTNYFSITEHGQKVVSVYPNPFINRIHIENLDRGNYTYEMYNAVGKKVQSGKVDENGEISTSPNLPYGHYYLTLHTESGQPLSIHLAK